MLVVQETVEIVGAVRTGAVNVSAAVGIVGAGRSVGVGTTSMGVVGFSVGSEGVCAACSGMRSSSGVAVCGGSALLGSTEAAGGSGFGGAS